MKEKMKEKEKEKEKEGRRRGEGEGEALKKRRFLLTFCCPDSAFLLSRFFLFPKRCALFFGVFANRSHSFFCLLLARTRSLFCPLFARSSSLFCLLFARSRSLFFLLSARFFAFSSVVTHSLFRPLFSSHSLLRLVFPSFCMLSACSSLRIGNFHSQRAHTGLKHRVEPCRSAVREAAPERA